MNERISFDADRLRRFGYKKKTLPNRLRCVDEGGVGRVLA